MNAPVRPLKANDHAQGDEPLTLDVIRLVAATPSVSQRQLASTLGVSVGKVNYCMRALVAKGFIKAENYRNSSNKLAYLYLLTPSGIAAKADLTRKFLGRKLAEYEALRLEIDDLRRETGETAPAPR